jgi:pimeloyl-ACP methyl ester carboxylesterase
VRRPRRTWYPAVACAALVLAAGCGSSDPAQGERPPGPSATVSGRESAQADDARQVDLGNGRSIHMECRGSGGPTVILVSGLGNRADTWMTTTADPSSAVGSVFTEVAGFTRVCAYDRPGTSTATESGFELSRSTPVAEPATVGDSAVDLALMLVASGEPGPYVLVGHSLGGPIVRLYAGAHPDDVAGLVLEDALSEDLGDGLTPTQRANFAELNDPAANGGPAGSEQDFYATAVVPLLHSAPPAPEVPTVVLTADQWPFTAETIDSGHASGALPAFVTLDFTDALWAAQLAAQDQLAAMFPWAEHLTQTHASHYIHLDNPALVIGSIRDVVDRVRSEPPR